MPVSSKQEKEKRFNHERHEKLKKELRNYRKHRNGERKEEIIGAMESGLMEGGIKYRHSPT